MNYIFIFVAIVFIINLLSFLNMKWDKDFAISHLRRISEKTLFTYALFLGATGIFIGMQKFRHKTKHAKFTILIPILMILNYVSIFYIIKAIFKFI